MHPKILFPEHGVFSILGSYNIFILEKIMDQPTTQPTDKSSSLPSSKGGYALLFVLIGGVIAVFVWYLMGRGTHEKLELKTAPVANVGTPLPKAEVATPAPSARLTPVIPELAPLQGIALEHVLFGQLLGQIQEGEPYEGSLTLLMKLTADEVLRQKLDALSRYAAQGVPSLTHLTEEALKKIDAHNTESQEAENMAVRVFTSLLSVKKKSSHQGVFVEALKHHDLKLAVQESAALVTEGYQLEAVVAQLEELESFFTELSVVRAAFEGHMRESLKTLPGRSL